MISRRVLVGGGAALGLAALVWFVTRPSDESRIKAQLDRLAKAVRITDDDLQTNPIARLAHVNGALESLLDHDVRVSVPELPGLGSGRQDVAQQLTMAPRFVRTFDVDWKNVTIKLDDPHTAALVGATAHVRARERGGGADHDEDRNVDFRFAKQGGEWIVTTITVWAPDEAPPR